MKINKILIMTLLLILTIGAVNAADFDFENSTVLSIGDEELDTTDSGTVSGDLDVATTNPWNTTGELIYDIPSEAKNIKSADVYVNVYAGSVQNTYGCNANVSINTTAGERQIASEILWTEEGSQDGTVYIVNNHTNKCYSDYQMHYNITDLLQGLNGSSVTIKVDTFKMDEKQFDGRIKLIALVLAYDDGDNDEITYWVDSTQKWTKNNTLTTFDTANLTNIQKAYLTSVVTSASDVNYTLNGESLEVPDNYSSGNYYQCSYWDVSDKINKGSNTELISQYAGTSLYGSLKNVLTILKVESFAVDVSLKTEYYSGPTCYAGTNNTLTITVKTNNTRKYSVELLADGILVNVTEVEISSGEQTTIFLTDPTIRPIDETTVNGANNTKVNYTVNVRYANDIAGSASLEVPVLYNGFLGYDMEYDIVGFESLPSFLITGDVVFDIKGSDSYIGSSIMNRTEDWDVTLPEDSELVSSFLFVPYNWFRSRDYNETEDMFNVTFNGKTIKPLHYYRDQFNLGNYGGYGYGILVYMLDDLLNTNGLNTLILNKIYSTPAVYPTALVYTYNTTGGTLKEVSITLGSDLLSAMYNAAGRTVKSDTNIVINVTDIMDATLYVFASSAQSNEGDIIVNEHKFENVWTGTSQTTDVFTADITSFVKNSNNISFVATGSTILALPQIIVIDTGKTANESLRKTFADLEALVNATSPGDVLELNNDYQNDGSISGDGITISKTITIDGQGHTIDGAGLARIFHIKADNVTLKNINFINGCSELGGAINCENDNLTIINCNFTNNTASEYGGAVYFSSNGTVSNCNFTDNQASRYGGAVYFSSNGTVINCNFTDNTASVFGGAVLMSSGSVENCNFTNNNASGNGSAIMMGSGTVTNCNFTNNTSNYGGAIRMYSGSVTNCNFIANSASGGGGAVYIRSNGNVTNCNFTNNTANSEGGAIFFYSDSNGNVTKCNFINCSAELGKAIYANNNTLISSCNFETQGSERLSELVMGGITSNCTVNGKKEKTATNMTIITEDITYGENATITVTMTTDGTVTININNQNIGLEITNGTGQITIPNLNVGEYIVKASFEGNSDYESANATTTLTVKSNMKTFEDITSLIGSAYVGDIINLEGTYYGTGLIITVNKELTISGDGETILDAKNLSGILSVSANNVKISNIRFVNGKINANGGAINWIGKNGMISNCTFINCSAENGGSVYWNAENGMINTSTFDKSTATQNGGAIYWNANSGEITDSTFTHSHAQNGGAVYVPENRNVEIKSSIFDSNIAEEESGAVYGGTVDDDCTFKNNTYTPVNTKTFISINETAVYTGNDILITTLILNNDKGVLVNTGTVEIYINSTLIATIPANTQYIHTTGEIGTYQVLAKFIDDSSYNGSSSTAEFTVIPVDIPEEIETSNEGIFTLEFPDDAEGTLTVFIDGVKYKVYDITGGILKIDLSYKKGKYNITFEYSGDKKYPAFKKDTNASIQTNPSIKASNAKVIYSAGTTYKITVYKNKGKTVNGVNVVIKQNNKKFKTIKTKSKGIVSFKVTQKPGTYKLKITTLGITVTKTLTVKHILTLKAVKVKKSAKKLILQATLAKVNKKYLKKKTVTFKFNGKKYKAKTNAKGVAKVTIKKSVLKKLKVGKKVTYQATYLKDTVKKTVKIKK